LSNRSAGDDHKTDSELLPNESGDAASKKGPKVPTPCQEPVLREAELQSTLIKIEMMDTDAEANITTECIEQQPPEFQLNMNAAFQTESSTLEVTLRKDLVAPDEGRQRNVSGEELAFLALARRELVPVEAVLSAADLTVASFIEMCRAVPENPYLAEILASRMSHEVIQTMPIRDVVRIAHEHYSLTSKKRNLFFGSDSCMTNGFF
jgi:hypothetical protein